MRLPRVAGQGRRFRETPSSFAKPYKLVQTGDSGHARSTRHLYKYSYFCMMQHKEIKSSPKQWMRQRHGGKAGVS